MLNKGLVKIALLLILSIEALSAYAQPSASDTSQGKILEIIKADRYNFQKIENEGEFISMAGNVKLKQGTTWFYCDSAVLNQTLNTVEAFGNVHINDADSIHTYAQYLKYLANEKVAYLKNKVRLTDKKIVLTTNDLEYNTALHSGTYTNGGKVVNGKTTLTSTEGYYYGETRDIYFKKKVVLVDPEYKVVTDTLLYNTYTEIARFVSPTTIYNGKRIIKTSEGFYDMKGKKAEFGKGPKIEDKDYTITAERMAFDDASGLSEAQGNVVYKSKDTASNFVILAGNIKSNNKTGAVLATQQPLMIIQQKADSIFIAADTLFTGKLTDLEKTRKVPFITSIPDSTDSVRLAKVKPDSSSNRFFEAYKHVRIFSDSLQAIGDSLFYSFKDSVFRLFKNPVVWAQDNQLTGDTIYLFTHNQKPERFYVFENAMAINKVDKELYNQVKGNTINGYFVDGSIDFFKAKGSAENIYYAADEAGGLIGVNRATSDVIDVYFEDKKPNKVVLRNNLEGVISPIRQVKNSEMRVRGFNWQDDKRPKSKTELFGN